MITRISRFATDAGSVPLTAGLEKTLRLLQGLSHIIIAYTTSPIDAAPWLQARKQFTLGRRYLRFFKFVDAFATASRSFNSSSGISSVLNVGKWSCLGMYLFLESCTIMDAMEIWSTSWGPTLLLEANKFWFYSLLFSLGFCLLQLYQLRFLSAHSSNTASRARSKASSNSLPRPLAKQILTDACDLLIPGSITGWARTSPAIVGLATVVSTLLASEEIWHRVQRAASPSNVKALRKENQVKRKGKV